MYFRMNWLVEDIWCIVQKVTSFILIINVWLTLSLSSKSCWEQTVSSSLWCLVQKWPPVKHGTSLLLWAAAKSSRFFWTRLLFNIHCNTCINQKITWFDLIWVSVVKETRNKNCLLKKRKELLKKIEMITSKGLSICFGIGKNRKWGKMWQWKKRTNRKSLNTLENERLNGTMNTWKEVWAFFLDFV